jgi:DNA-directed RNA polymerase alpha subunit
MSTLQSKTDYVEYLDKYGLTTRAYNSLKRYGVHTITDLRALTIDDLYDLRNISHVTVNHIIRCLDEYNKEHGGEGLKETERKGTYTK